MRRGGVAVAAVLALLAAPSVHADPWFVEIRLGNAWNAPLPLKIRQPGSPTLDHSPRWSTRGFEFPLWYGARVGRGDWAVDLVHHKLHLENPPAEVGAFAISHGYNLLMVERRTERDGWHHGAGAGLVLAHPETEVRGRKLDEARGLFGRGYHVAGPAVALLGGPSWHPAARVEVGAEVALTFAWAEVPVAGGWARVPNLAIHGSIALRLTEEGR